MDKLHMGPELPRLVTRMVESYLADERTQHIDKDYLPSRERAIGICDLLLELTYPGGYGRRGLTTHNLPFHVGELLPRLWELLTQEIKHCFLHDLENDGRLPADLEPCHSQAAAIATTFVEQIPQLRAILSEDVQAHYDGDPAAQSTAEIILAYPGMLAITIQRYAHQLYAAGVPKLPRIMAEHAHRLTGIDIHPGATIGKRFFIDHGTGVVIGETAHVGDNVKIYQGVTLGALSFPKDARGRLVRGHKRHPTVGNNVTIYANAIILGGQTVIGDGAIIGGSVFLTHSVQPGHRVTMPAPSLEIRGPHELPVERWDFSI